MNLLTSLMEDIKRITDYSKLQREQMKSSNVQKARSQDYDTSNWQGRLKQGFTISSTAQKKSSKKQVYDDLEGDDDNSKH